MKKIKSTLAFILICALFICAIPIKSEASTITSKLKKSDKLMESLDFMVHYNLNYKANKNFTSNQWKLFISACLQNSWSEPFYDYEQKYYPNQKTKYKNEYVSKVATLATGSKKTYKGKSLSKGYAASPYLFSYEKKKFKVTTLSKNKYKVTYNFVYTTSSLDTKNKTKKVTAVIKKNSKSPLDGYSIISLSSKQI